MKDTQCDEGLNPRASQTSWTVFLTGAWERCSQYPFRKKPKQRLAKLPMRSVAALSKVAKRLPLALEQRKKRLPSQFFTVSLLRCWLAQWQRQGCASCISWVVFGQHIAVVFQVRFFFFLLSLLWRNFSPAFSYIGLQNLWSTDLENISPAGLILKIMQNLSFFLFQPTIFCLPTIKLNPGE